MLLDFNSYQICIIFRDIYLGVHDIVGLKVSLVISFKIVFISLLGIRDSASVYYSRLNLKGIEYSIRDQVEGILILNYKGASRQYFVY